MLPAQLRLLELPEETILAVLEEEMAQIVDLCLDRENESAEGLAIDFVFEPKRGEAMIAEVRYREESQTKTAVLLECVEEMSKLGPMPMELIDMLNDGVYLFAPPRRKEFRRIEVRGATICSICWKRPSESSDARNKETMDKGVGRAPAIPGQDGLGAWNRPLIVQEQAESAAAE